MVSSYLYGPPHSQAHSSRGQGGLTTSMRTIGNEVDSGRLRKSTSQRHRSGIGECRPGYCTLLLHASLVRSDLQLDGGELSDMLVAQNPSLKSSILSASNPAGSSSDIRIVII